MRTMPMFFQDEFNIYRKMLLRESQKSIAGLEILNSFVSSFPPGIQSKDVDYCTGSDFTTLNDKQFERANL